MILPRADTDTRPVAADELGGTGTEDVLARRGGRQG